MTAIPSALDTLLEAAILAPSGDNTQPWRFTVDRDNWAITMDVDPARDPSPMNAGQMMARIAVGAAVENMVRTAEQNRWNFDLEGENGDGPVTLRLGSHSAAGLIDPLILSRVTNRRIYQRCEISDEQLRKLREDTGEFGGVGAIWITDRQKLDQLSSLIARADALILSTKPIRDAFLAKVRFDQPANAIVKEGLSLGCLEVSRFEQRMLKAMKYVPDGVLRTLGGRRVFAGVAKKLVDSASGICLIGADNESYSGRLAAGRLWQRAWLAVTGQGFAAQPMMSLCVLQNIRDNHPAELIDQVGGRDAAKLLKDFKDWLVPFDTSDVATLMRWGYAPSPTTRTGRINIANFVH
jgi:uncharacterized protein YjeT (DUF2065 family)